MKDMTSLTVPHKVKNNWQNIVDILADVAKAEAGYITKISEGKIKILKVAPGASVIEEGKMLDLAEVYCHKAVDEQKIVEINDARQIDKWQDSHSMELGFISYLGIPIFQPQSRDVFGTICVVDSEPRNFSPKEKNLLKEFKQSIENQLKIIELNNKLKRQVELTQSSLDSLSAHIVVIDEKGIIRYTNEAWKNFAEKSGASAEQLGERSNFLEITEKAKNEDAEKAEEVVKGIKSVISGKRDFFALEYPCDTPEEKKWFKLKATPFLGDGDKAVVIAHEEITERKKAEKKLNLTQFSVDNAAIGIFQITPGGKFEYVNDKVCEMLNYTRDELIGKRVSDVDSNYSPEERKKRWSEIKKNKTNVIETRHKTKNGKTFPVQVTSRYLKYQEKEYEFAFVQDISERKAKVKELQEYKERIDDIFNNIGDIVWSMSWPDLKVDFISKPVENLIGYSKEKFKKKGFMTRITHHEDKHIHSKALKELKEQGYTEREFRINLKDGSVRWIYDEQYMVYDDKGNPVKVRGIMRDITERKEKERQLKYKTFHDELTGLYNRTFLAQEMERLDTERQLPISTIMVDINGLKIINNTYGHEEGDRVLKKAAEILESVVRDEDILARYGGDEFVILLPQTDNEIAHDIYDRIEKKSQKKGEEEFPVSIGMGTATKTDPEENINDILKQADENMLQNKLVDDKSSKNRIVKSLLNTLAAKSDETKEHAMRMSHLAHQLGEKVGVTNSKLNKLSLVATLHDIGKTIIPEKVLTKPGDLTDEEWQMMQEHPEKGYKIASASEEFAVVAEEILSHHERWDGGGYPRGLEEEEIPFLARIISIIDAYDVMTNGRPYKEPMSKEEALQEIEDCAGSQFDPHLAEEFVEMMENNE